MAVKHLAKTFQYGLLPQNNWATPLSRNSNYKTVAYNSGVTIFDPDITPGLFNTSSQNGIHKEFERVFVDGASGLPKMNFSMPADLKTITPHLAGALFVVSEAVGTPFNKTITAGGLAGVIDFNGDDTTVYTLSAANKASNDDQILLENAIIENLNLSWDFNATGVARLMQMTGNWIGNEIVYEQIFNGSWTTTTFTPMGNTDLFTLGTFTVDGVDFSSEVVRRFTFNVANNVKGSASTTAGKSNQYDIAPVYTSQILLDYNSVTEKALKDFKDGATVVATIDSSIGTGSEGNFTIACTGGIIQSAPFEYNSEFAAIGLNVMWHSTSAATPVTITISDAVDWGY